MDPGKGGWIIQGRSTTRFAVFLTFKIHKKNDQLVGFGLNLSFWHILTDSHGVWLLVNYYFFIYKFKSYNQFKPIQPIHIIIGYNYKLYKHLVVSWNRGTPNSHPFSWHFPWNKPNIFGYSHDHGDPRLRHHEKKPSIQDVFFLKPI